MQAKAVTFSIPYTAYFYVYLLKMATRDARDLTLHELKAEGKEIKA